LYNRRDLGLLLLRMGTGGVLVAHGAQKLFGWFGGYGLDGTAGFFEQVGHRPGRLMATAAGMSEMAGGLLLLSGLLTPLGAAIVIGVMAVAAVSVHKDNGLWATNGGYELPLLYAVVAAALAFTGPGSWSVDNAIGWDLDGWGYGIGAIVVGLVAAGVQLSRRTTGATEPAGDAYPADVTAGDPAMADETATR
jgi:putative oxidoreductase